VRRLWECCRRRPDPFVAGLLTALAAISLAFQGQLGSLPGSLCVLGFCALVATRPRHSVFVAVSAGLLIAIPEFAHDAAVINNNSSFIPVWAAIFLFAYGLGSDAPFPLSLLGVAGILAGVNLSAGGFNPVPEMVALGPYAGGLAVASRRRASAQLELRIRELDEEREIFALESVRYERARIARELHDIVAHCVSLMVVQANAGERLAAIDPERAADAFASISEAAQLAEQEIRRLVELLNDASPIAASVRIVEELVARAQASGLAISCRFSGDIDDLSAHGADTAYRIVQEGITNSMKHAPGASMAIYVCGDADAVKVRVLNGPAVHGSSGLEQSGGRNGLSGMRERVLQCGGTFSASATAEGGWELVGTLPRQASLPLARSEGP
jgi:signal transduction histidine kinase